MCPKHTLIPKNLDPTGEVWGNIKCLQGYLGNLARVGSIGND